MRKVFNAIFTFLLFCAALRACGVIMHPSHDWQPATCTEPRTCSSCGATEGNPLGHYWQKATCTEPKTCLTCGITSGSRAPHTWVEATCTEPEHCSVCNKLAHWYSLPLDHDWIEANCTTPKTCSLCGVTEGSPQHDFDSYVWEYSVEPTCQSEGEKFHACKLCGAIETKVVPVIGHKAGPYQTIREATPDEPGLSACYCVVCGTLIEEHTIRYVENNSSSKINSGNSGGSNSANNFNTYNNESQQETSSTYVLNTSTKKFHRPSCRDVPKIAPGNYSTISETRETVISMGYQPCGHCVP